MTLIAEILMAVGILLFLILLFYYGLIYSPRAKG